MNGYTKVKSIQYFFVKSKNNRQVPQGKIDHTPTPYTLHGGLISPVVVEPTPHFVVHRGKKPSYQKS